MGGSPSDEIVLPLSCVRLAPNEILTGLRKQWVSKSS